MNIFIIRHGETDYNRRHVHQPAQAQLNERGRRQALATAKVVHGLHPTHLVSSTHARAEETANIMNRSLKLQHDARSEFGELQRPDYILGHKHFGFRSFVYLFGWFYSHQKEYSNSEKGESRLTFLRRVFSARNYLETFPNDARVVVVSHSVFINFFIEHICNDNPIPIWKAVLVLMKIKKLDNSSITHVTYDQNAPAGTCKWNLISFDSDAHVVT